MAYLDHRDPSTLSPADRRLHAQLADEDGVVDNIVWVHSVNPPALRHHLQLYEHAMRGPSPLTEVQREMIALTVSASNDCFY